MTDTFRTLGKRLEELEFSSTENERADKAFITAQAQTIERLADALESLESYISCAANGDDIRWYAVNADEGKAARALLAEIRGKHE